MEVIYKSENGRTEVRFQCEGQKQLVERLSMLADVIEGEPCGCCGSDRVRAEHRHVQTYDYYCIRCVACGAQLSFGQYKDGKTLFIKRADADGNPVGKNGWYHYGEQRGGKPMAQTTGQRGDAAEYGAEPEGGYESRGDAF